MLEKTVQEFKRQMFRNPRDLIFECTKRCNASCRYCGRQFDQRPDSDLPFWLIRKVIRECRYASRVHTQDVGEPLLYPELAEVISYAKTQGKNVMTYTNGSLLTKDKSAELMNAGLDELRISVDYADKKLFEHERRGLKWEVVKRNIIDCKQVRDAKGFATKLTIRGCITRVNRSFLRDIKEYWMPYVDDVVFQEEIAVPRPAQFASHRRFTEINWPYIDCQWPKTKFVIKSNGVASMCCRDWYLQYPIGEIKEDMNSLDIFNSRRMQTYRRQIRTKQIPALCTFCNDKVKRRKQ